MTKHCYTVRSTVRRGDEICKSDRVWPDPTVPRYSSQPDGCLVVFLVFMFVLILAAVIHKFLMGG
jgi:hypothetical protein